MPKNEYSPVLIPTLCRYEHFKRCVESLANNTHAEKTELVIGLDYPPSEKYFEGWKAINDYVDTISGFKKVTVFKETQNIGARLNFRKLTDYAISHYDSYIITEDDNEFSPCFLDFMYKALIKYWDDNRVYAIGGYSYPVDMSKYTYNVYFHHDQAAWGLARWKHKRIRVPEHFREDMLSSFKKLLKLWWRDSRLFYLLLSMTAKKTSWDDALHGICNVINNQYVLYPTVSMSRNYGHDGSGLHCGDSKGEDIFSRQMIDAHATIDIDDIPIAECQEKSLKKYFRMPLVEKISCVKHFLYYKFDIAQK